MDTRPPRRGPALLAVCLLGLLAGAGARAAEWQWWVPVPNCISGETKAAPRAFLWIPPACVRVRAVVVGQHNMEEESILEHPVFRQACADTGIAQVWVTPGFDLGFNSDKGAGELFEGMMQALAQASGYGELAFAPVVPLGHSAAAGFPWNFAAWNPGRTLAALSVSGSWPYYQAKDQPVWREGALDGVPGLTTIGEYEWANQRMGDGVKLRVEHPQAALSALSEPAAGHFAASPGKIAYLALYLRKAAGYRLPANAPLDKPVALKAIDPTREGWLADRWRQDQPPKAPAAPVGAYTGDQAETFWYFDEELAQATEALQAEYRYKKGQLLGYVQNSAVVPQTQGTHQQVNLAFLPMADGISFRLAGTFLDTVPKGRPEKWVGLAEGLPVAHATGGGPVVIERICGPVVQTGPDTFAVNFYRMGLDNPKRSNDIWLAAWHPGDEHFKRAVQQAQMRIPIRNTQGTAQEITFPPLPDQRAGASGELKLAATASSGLPVSYYVLAGPAVVGGDVLRLTGIPPRSKFPVKVTVVAWQYGRNIAPKVQSAVPVEQSFLIRND